MTEQKVKIGIIGFGRRTRQLISEIKKNKKGEIYLVYDENVDVCEKFKNECNSTNGLTNDYDYFWSNKYDIVIIASSNHTHKKYILDCFDNNVNVFCEKPIITTIDDYMAVINKYNSLEEKKLFATGFVLRFSPIFKKIKELMPKIGKVQNYIATDILNHSHGAHIFIGWRRFEEFSGGHTVEKGCHILDLLNWFVESYPTEVYSIGGNNYWTPENIEYKQKLLDYDKDVFKHWNDWENLDPFTSEKTNYDNIVSTIKYKNGVNGTLTLLTYAPNSKRTMTFYGLNGSLEFDWAVGQPKITVCTQGVGVKTNSQNPCVEEVYTFGQFGCHGGGDEILVDSLMDAVRNSTEMHPNITEAFQSNNPCIAMTESLKTNLPVKVIY